MTIKQNLTDRIPIQYINYDSWWYIKGNDLGVKSWTAQEDIFPSGMESLYTKTGLPVVAHNRYWATDTVYSRENGGQFTFVTEKETNRSLPQDPDFWKYLFSSSLDWGLEVYEQDWQVTMIMCTNVDVISLIAGQADSRHGRHPHQLHRRPGLAAADGGRGCGA